MADAVDTMLSFGPVSPSSKCERTTYRAEAIAAGGDPQGLNPATAPEINWGPLEPLFDTSSAAIAASHEPGFRSSDGRDARRNELIFIRPNHVVVAIADGTPGMAVVTTDFGQAKPHRTTLDHIEGTGYGKAYGVSSTFGGHPIPNIGGASASAAESEPEYIGTRSKNMAGYGYRLLGMKGLTAVADGNPEGTQLVLAEMDPDPMNIAGGHRNVWVEAPMQQRAEWPELFGPIHYIDRADTWDWRSNDPNRISTFPADNDPTAVVSGGLSDAQLKVLQSQLVDLIRQAGANKEHATAALPLIAKAIDALKAT